VNSVAEMNGLQHDAQQDLRGKSLLEETVQASGS
jgi:hypothetical protein